LSNGQLEQITQLINPTAITIGVDDFLYIADRNQGAIIQFDPANYQEIQCWRYDDLKLATGDTITGVSDLAVDKAGNMYLANGDVYKFDQNGKLLTTFQVFKERLPIRGIAVDSKGNLYVAHFELSYGSNNHIAKYSANGNYLLQWQREEWQSSGCPMICPKGAGWLVLIAIALFVIAIPVTPLVLFIRWLLKPKPQQP
jgi:streptogramin lyase